MSPIPILGAPESAAGEGCAVHYMEHRWGRRIRCDASVRISSGARQTGPGRMRDVSMSGAYIETAVEFPVFAPVVVAVLRDGGGEVELAGCVVRRDASGVGIEWSEASPGAICPVLGCTTPCAAAARWS